MMKELFFKTTYLIITLCARVTSYEKEDKALVIEDWESIDWQMSGWPWYLVSDFLWRIKRVMPTEWCAFRSLVQIWVPCFDAGDFARIILNLDAFKKASYFGSRPLQWWKDSPRNNQRARSNFGRCNAGDCNLILLNVNEIGWWSHSK